MQYHVSPHDGNPRVCRAKTACPYGDDEVHYESSDEARSAYEREAGSSFSAGPESWATRTEASLALQRLYPSLEFTLQDKSGYVILAAIKVPKEEQKSGLGSAFMKDLVSWADHRDQSLALTPSTDWGASSKSRLERFYRRYGFTPNKGRHRDFTTMESMVRPPMSSYR